MFFKEHQTSLHPVLELGLKRVSQLELDQHPELHKLYKMHKASYLRLALPQ